MKALVISGGGTKGAYAGGVAEYLIGKCGKQYKLFIGTSTGSLLMPFLASGNIDKAKSIFTNVKKEDIFTICPFSFDKKEGINITSFNHLAIVQMLLKHEKTLGDSSNLRKFISDNFPEEIFFDIISNDINIITTVANLTKQTIEYKSILDYNYSEFCDWIWASANVVPFMSLLTKNGCDYGDGGFGDLIPIKQAIAMGATSIDVIILRPTKPEFNLSPIINPLQLMLRTNEFMLRQIGNDDILIGELEAKNQHISINFFYTPRILAEHTFVFDSEILQQWWQEGYDYASKIINT